MAYCNLVKETLSVMMDEGYKESDVVAVLDERSMTRMSWGDFKEKYKTFTYDAGFGSVSVNLALKIAFKDGSWLERSEYDGYEEWEHKKPFNLDDFQEGEVIAAFATQHLPFG